ncbi:MAG: methyltransferase domain-containing protein [Vicingaceae bacterium]|nr:methyltransferase domain-containing protein [Vicingaceae bacterium]
MSIKKQLQNTDIYLIDQILKGRFKNTKLVLDAGCGTGRNLSYFLQNGLHVYGLDSDEKKIEQTKQNALKINPSTPLSNFKVATAEQIPFTENFDLIICNAVLHFSKNKEQFDEILFSLWSKLNDNGILFIRLASNIGIEKLVKPLSNGNFQLPDNTKRYLVSESDLLNYTKNLNAELIEPIKTTNVQSLRCMTTWILRK